MKEKKTQSRLFTNAEYEELKTRLNGEKKNYSIWSNRLKPKLIELLTLEKYFDEIKDILFGKK